LENGAHKHMYKVIDNTRLRARLLDEHCKFGKWST